MLSVVFNLFLYIFEMLTAYIYFSKNYIKKNVNILTVFLIGCTLFIPASFVFTFIGKESVNYIVSFLVNFLFATIIFKINIRSALLQTLILLVLMFFTEIFTLFLFSSVFGFSTNAFKSDVFIFIMLAVISKCFYLISSQIFTFFIKRDNINELNNKYLVPLYSFPVLAIISSLFFTYIALEIKLSLPYKIVIVSIALLFIITCVLLFLYYQKLIENENKIKELETEQKVNKINETYLDILEHQNQNLKVYAHDTKKHLSAIRNLTENEEIIKYLEQMTDDLNEYNRVVSSGNHNLDVILNKYITECEIKKIDFKYDVRLSNLKSIEIYDLVTVLGNALDNALESAVNTPEKKIELKTDYKNNFDIIVIKNSCDKKPNVEDNTLKTTKENKTMHGLGLKSMKNALSKYNGDFSWEYIEEDKMFVLTVMVMRG